MLFEQELQNQLVPEWRAKYLDYKTAKKKLNACEQALRKANQTPKFFAKSNTSRGGQTPVIPNELLQTSARTPHPVFNDSKVEERRQEEASNALSDATQALRRVKYNAQEFTASENQPINRRAAKEPWRTKSNGGKYGSLGSTPNAVPEEPENDPEASAPKVSPTAVNTDDSFGSPLQKTISAGVGSLRLPGPAIPSSVVQDSDVNDELTRAASIVNPSAQGRIVRHVSVSGEQPPRHEVRRAFTSPYLHSQKPTGLFKRYFSRAKQGPPASMELPLEAYREFDTRRADFFAFLDDQLQMVAEFYKQKEDQAVDRFEVLKEQLEVLKEHQTKRSDAAATERRSKRYRLSLPGLSGVPTKQDQLQTANKSFGQNLKDKFVNKMPTRPARLQTVNTSESFKDPLGAQISRSSNHAVKDYGRTHEDVPYTEARSKLKHALQEFYRNIDMLKSYAMLNREAFRKIIKKYDKTISSRHAGKFMAERVDKTWFVRSDVVDTLMASVENQYAYFEKGSHKIAANKLRAKHNLDYSPSSFRNGLLLGAGSAIGFRGLAYASEHFYYDPDPVVVVQTSFLLQIYGGYFLALFLFLAFCIDCRFWTRNRINHVFIFEFDPRTSLDWRQLAEIPSLLWFLLGLIMWLNFSPYAGGPATSLWLYYPVILAGLTALLIFFPFQHFPLIYPRIKDGRLRFYRKRVGFLYPHSRAWFAFSNFRLYTGGLYPVEFRDFFLGDMYCSLTYAMGNIELFFCLYARGWSNPPGCNSSNSMLFGFFTCIPGIWRALQCLRRYKDTGMAFPHLANFGKYICTILFYMTLSLYRLDETATKKAVFITFATINSLYVSIWDVFFDWSLSFTHGERALISSNKTRGGQTRFGFPTWYYYPAVILDPLLRFNWIFYAFLFGELQHSALLSFFVALSEIFRRSFWALFRVENEHMTNVGMFRASRDVPLPYSVKAGRSSSTISPSETESQTETMNTPQRVVTAIAAAHTFDFQRRKPREDSDDDDEDDDEGDASESDAGGSSV